jgi:serine/threonine protein kinase
MEQDELALYLDFLRQDACYRVEEVLKEGPYETTQRVSSLGANGLVRGSYIRKYLAREPGLGLGTAYETLFQAWQAGKRFKHLPRIYGCHQTETDLVVVMEYIAGTTLQDVVRQSSPSIALVEDVFPRLCGAVTELHEGFAPPIIHRDLKPSNIMLTQDGLKLIDFGIARTYREEADQDTHYFGTRFYAPPEQFGFGQTDVRSDIYALGMLLSYCLVEKTPTAAVRDGGFADLAIADAFRKIIIKATRLDPRERYHDANEMKAAILKALPVAKVPQTAMTHSLTPHGVWRTEPSLPRSTGSGRLPGTKRRLLRSTGSGLLSRIPRSVGVVWDVLVGLIFLLALAASCSLVVNPLPEYRAIPLYQRVVMHSVVLFFALGPAFYLVLDKRVFERFMPVIVRTSLPKQLLACLIVFAIGFVTIGVCGSLWNW